MDETTIYLITTGGVNVRSSAEIANNKVTIAVGSEIVTVESDPHNAMPNLGVIGLAGQPRGWINIRMASGIVGWISVSMLRHLTDEEEQRLLTQLETPHNILDFSGIFRTKSGTILYSDTRTDSTEILSVSQGHPLAAYQGLVDAVESFSQPDGWVHVQTRNGRGWVQTKDIESIPVAFQFNEDIFDISEVRNIQWFGNTKFAEDHGMDHNYPDFSQGLHPGFDFGPRKGDFIVKTGVAGTIQDISQTNYKPNGIYYSFDIDDINYLIIYGHLDEVFVSKDDMLDESDPLGTIKIDGAALHLHIEVRMFIGGHGFILNPLLYFPKSIRHGVLAATFEHWANWPTWQTALNQPTLLNIGNLVIGPSA